MGGNCVPLPPRDQDDGPPPGGTRGPGSPLLQQRVFGRHGMLGRDHDSTHIHPLGSHITSTLQCVVGIGCLRRLCRLWCKEQGLAGAATKLKATTRALEPTRTLHSG